MPIPICAWPRFMGDPEHVNGKLFKKQFRLPFPVERLSREQLRNIGNGLYLQTRLLTQFPKGQYPVGKVIGVEMSDAGRRMGRHKVKC